MINIAICDDNKAMLDYLSREIGECFQEALVNTKISSFDSGKAFVLSHRSTPFDVVFLDIVMPDINGFDVAKIVRQISDETYIILLQLKTILFMIVLIFNLLILYRKAKHIFWNKS